MERQEIFKKVREILVETLCLEEEEITSETTLISDLGLESIDILDIIFSLEKMFGIKINRDELLPSEKFITDPELVCENKLTAKGVALLKEKAVHLDLTEFEKDPDIDRLGKFFNIDGIVSYIEYKLQ